MKPQTAPNNQAIAKFFEKAIPVFLYGVKNVGPIRPDLLKACLDTLENASSEEGVAVRASIYELAAQLDHLCSSFSETISLDVAAFREKSRSGSTARLFQRAKQTEMVTSAQLQEAWGVGSPSIRRAMRVGNIFSLIGDSGKNIYPAFFADMELEQYSVQMVVKALGSLPSPTKYMFFVVKSRALSGHTPLQALRNGQLSKVVGVASAFAKHIALITHSP